MIKNRILKFSCLTGLSVMLMMSACQSKKDQNTESQTDTTDSVEEVKSEPVREVAQESVEETTNTTSIQDRMGESGGVNYIKLDFAQTQNPVDDTTKARLVDGVCAVSVAPDSSWSSEKQAEMGENWVELASDSEYYKQLGIDELKKANIPTILDSREKQYINFVKKDQSNYTIDLTKMKDAWGLILFNGVDNPVFWSGTDISPELKSIYKK